LAATWASAPRATSTWARASSSAWTAPFWQPAATTRVCWAPRRTLPPTVTRPCAWARWIWSSSS